MTDLVVGVVVFVALVLGAKLGAWVGEQRRR
jgi:hypothetical protein